jgi:hypothetical protein
MDESKKTRILMELVAALFIFFFTINQMLNQLLLVELLELIQYDTTLIYVNYLILFLLSAGLIFLAGYEIRSSA